MKTRLGPDGYHLFDRKTGLNVLIDEQIPSPDLWTEAPRQVSIALTNACDLKCTHCYAPKSPGRLRKEQVKAWMIELDEAGCHGIGFGGGEPMLHPQFAELCEFGAEETELAITTTTHGLSITEDLIRRLQGSLHFMRVSMDGVGKTYESIRGVSFKNFLQQLNLLSGKVPFGINYVVNEQTVGDLDSASIIAAKSGAVELLLLPEEGVGRGTRIGQKTLAKLQRWVDSYEGGMQICISSAHQDLFLPDIPLRHEHPLLSFAHINANGILKETSFDEDGAPIGPRGVMAAFQEIRTKSLERIL